MSDIEKAFELELQKLPIGAQRNIRESMARNESLSWTMFKAGWEAATKSLEQRE